MSEKMTREEAIAFFKDMNECTYGNLEAVEMAIKALSQEPTKREIEREYLFQSLCEDFKKLQAENDNLKKTFEQEPCDDAISREWLMRKATERFYTTNYFNHISAMIEEAPSVTPKPIECDNAVSREAILSKIKEVCFSKEWTQFRIDNGSNGQRDFLINYIEQLPSVTQKSGKWIKKEYWEPLPYDTEPLDYYIYDEKTHSVKVYHYYCSVCDRDEGEFKPTYKYCPNCGAK